LGHYLGREEFFKRDNLFGPKLIADTSHNFQSDPTREAFGLV